MSRGWRNCLRSYPGNLRLCVPALPAKPQISPDHGNGDLFSDRVRASRARRFANKRVVTTLTHQRSSVVPIFLCAGRLLALLSNSEESCSNDVSGSRQDRLPKAVGSSWARCEQCVAFKSLQTTLHFSHVFRRRQPRKIVRRTGWQIGSHIATHSEPKALWQLRYELHEMLVSGDTSENRPLFDPSIHQ